MTDDLGQALVHCREKVEGLYKDIERLKADNARLRADYLSRIPREHYAQMQQQIDELSRKCVRLSDERDRLRSRQTLILEHAKRVTDGYEMHRRFHENGCAYLDDPMDDLYELLREEAKHG